MCSIHSLCIFPGKNQESVVILPRRVNVNVSLRQNTNHIRLQRAVRSLIVGPTNMNTKCSKHHRRVCFRK